MQRFDVWNFDIMRSEFMYTNWTYWTDIKKKQEFIVSNWHYAPPPYVRKV
jgi:hypothetical protein